MLRKVMSAIWKFVIGNRRCRSTKELAPKDPHATVCADCGKLLDIPIGCDERQYPDRITIACYNCEPPRMMCRRCGEAHVSHAVVEIHGHRIERGIYLECRQDEPRLEPLQARR
jgi:hypothetical protein